jgi:hypothetical protein
MPLACEACEGSGYEFDARYFGYSDFSVDRHVPTDTVPFTRPAWA